MEWHNETKAEDIDAWVHCSNTAKCVRKDGNMYMPILVTVQEALEEEAQASTRIVARPSDYEMLAGIRASAAKGRRPLLIGVGTRFGYQHSSDVVKAAVKAGAYAVLYSTEPNEADVLMHLANETGAHEVWVYAMSMVDQYPPDFKQLTPVRYMPPGYSPRLDVHVDLASPKRQTHNVGFLGNMVDRPRKVRDVLAAELGDRFREASKIWDTLSMRSYLEQYPMQLNMHKGQTCCPHRTSEVSAMEAFRLATLLANHACVISTPVGPNDTAMWDGIVHWAESDDTMEAVKSLEHRVGECQETSFKLFKDRFQPARLMRATGFLNAWHPYSHGSLAR